MSQTVLKDESGSMMSVGSGASSNMLSYEPYISTSWPLWMTEDTLSNLRGSAAHTKKRKAQLKGVGEGLMGALRGGVVRHAPAIGEGLLCEGAVV